MGGADTPQSRLESQRLELKLRSVGHQILLAVGDSTSRVLPIEEIDGEYHIGFSDSLAILPNDLVDAADEAMAEANLPTRYMIRVIECKSQEVVYGYERNQEDLEETISCLDRSLEYGCYKVLVRFPDYVGQRSSQIWLWLVGFGVLGLLGFGVYRFTAHRPGSIRLGKYQFNPGGMFLIIRKERIELTTRESELLHLLYKSLNETVKKETILHVVWGDEGSYDGRTLDVFISRLRKKLIRDERVKLVNVKGVGYKLVVEP